MEGKQKMLRKFLSFPAFILLFCYTLSFAVTHGKPEIVYMGDDYYSPKTILVHAGQTVTWINKGKNNHTVTSDQDLFNFQHIKPGSHVSYTFTKPGTYYYSCTLHTIWMFGMRGKVIVQ